MWRTPPASDLRHLTGRQLPRELTCTLLGCGHSASPGRLTLPTASLSCEPRTAAPPPAPAPAPCWPRAAAAAPFTPPPAAPPARMPATASSCVVSSAHLVLLGFSGSGKVRKIESEAKTSRAHGIGAPVVLM